ncbi:Serine/threonine-protein kinase tel1 [Emydomyces testavorans]|uniref:Serine/threonine-protein kinase Tel1 n=1 Tax=Emydomyces testavorans TaxID=2070801 RepID=A0AAF0INP8_9EURO|nr:Serine/threonine-protein kinase tel1 [Emydomyces testavorans]
MSSGRNLLDDKGYHRIFEALFRFISIEKATYNRSIKPGPKSQAASRLSTCASVFRTTAELSVRTIRSKTVVAVVYHITDALPNPSEGLWEPLSADYIKALRTFLQYPPHVEHLSSDDWHCLINFCLRGIGVGAERGESQLTIRSGRLTSESFSDLGSRAGSLAPRTSQRDQNSHVDLKSNAEELELCIQLLTSSPTSPVLDAAGKLLRGLMDYLISLNPVGRSPHAAFSAMNTVIAKAITDNTQLVQKTLFGILPTIRRLWVSKSAPLREEMLTTLMLGKDILTKKRVSSAELPIEVLQDLVEQIHQTYTRLSEKDILQLDDLIFMFDSTSIPMSIKFMAPRLASSKSVQHWVTLSTIATLSKLVDDLYLIPNHSGADKESNKRQQLLSRIDDIFRDASSSIGVYRLCALQLIPFIICQVNVDPERVSSLLQLLTLSILDENSTISSWTMIAIASIASCDCVSSAVLRTSWAQIWELASRALPSVGTTRAACTLMCTILHSKLLDYVHVVNTIESIISSVGLNGPASLTDSSLCLWRTMMEWRSRANPAQSQEMAKQICGWLKITWTIGPVCRLAKMWICYHQRHKLIKYLLLIDAQDSFEYPSDSQNTDGRIDIECSTRNHSSDIIILDLLQARLDSFSQTWTQIFTDKSNHVSAETIQTMVSLCVINYSFIEFLPSHSFRSQNLQRATDSLWKILCERISQDATLLQYCLDVLSPLILSLKPPFNRKSIILKALSRISSGLLPILKRQRDSERNGANLAGEIMELDDQFSSQESGFVQSENFSKVNREDSGSQIFEDSDSVRVASTVQFSLLEKFLSIEEHPGGLSDLISSCIETWDEVDILAGWTYLTNFVNSNLDITRGDACTLIEYFGERCLESYMLGRCEASISACIKLMMCFVELWTVHESDDLHDSASDLYIWFIDILIGKGVGTSKVLVRLAELLEHVLEVNPTFLRENQCPSPRTSLFNILQEGDLAVKFHISSLIPRIFGGFVLKEHDAIFDDILKVLPRDRGWDEGIALRLFLLARLASRWHTLLRRSIYHILETPGPVPSVISYAKVCLQYVSKTLGLTDARDIFKLFSSQIIYTWMETQSLIELPFEVFCYDTLMDLLVDIQDEIIAQVIMRVKEEEMPKISECLGTSFQNLLVKSFYKAEAYSIALDASMPPSQDPKVRRSEIGMTRLLGTENFRRLVERFFPEIVAVMFKSMDQTEQIEKAFAKHPSFQPALATLRNICERSASTATIPIGQQPSFRARHLITELEVLCKRTGYELETMWTAALVSFVARELIETIHPALGSLHACAVIRKLRVLVAIAGPIVLEDYPLELLLHCLCPFLTDFQCSADAIGIYWYLIDKGREHLFNNPSFLAGLAVSTLASVRGFLSSRQDSTTQETHFRATMSTAQTFHRWFSQFLDEYQAPALNDVEQTSLRKIIISSQNIRLTGNASKGTYEGELMVELLQDKVTGRKLLSSAASELVFTQLCQNFQKPENFRDDILGDDQTASSNTVGLWSSLENQTLGCGYRLWVARALGRSFASTGVINESLLKEQRVAFFENTLMDSKVSILRALCDCLLSNNPRSVGLAERTLQAIMNGLTKRSALEEFEEAIPPSLINALVWAPYHCPQLALKDAEKSSFDPTIRWMPSISVLEFAKIFSLALSFKASNDPVVGALQPILFAIPTLAAQLLPYILHDVLLFESDGVQKTREAVSVAFREAFRDSQEFTLPHIRLIICCILYLRYQVLPNESTMDERDNWLDVEYIEAAHAATKCRMYKTALLFIEIQFSRIAASSRRSSAVKFAEPTELLHTIFSNIDDPDMFYGIQQDPSVDSLLGKLSHESSGLKNLAFQSANYDTDMKMDRTTDDRSALEIVKALNSSHMEGIANAMFHGPGKGLKRPDAFDNMLSTALYLQQWDIPIPNTTSPTGNLFKALQALNMFEERAQIVQTLDECFLDMLGCLSEESQSFSSLKDTMRVLGLLSEMDEIMSSESYPEVKESWERILKRTSWLEFENFHDVGQILSAHEGIFSVISRKPHLRAMLNLSSRDAQLLQVKVIRESLRISRAHDAHQASLKSAMLLTKLVEPCSQLGVEINAAATFDLANVLWDQGEMTTSIKMLQQLSEQNDLQKQSIPLNRAEILASLGHHIAEARLEKPDLIIQNYLTPAITELKGRQDGEEAGLAFHEFAAFCDQQLQNPEMLEDFKRIEQIRHRKQKEVEDLDLMMKAAEGKEKDQLRHYRTKAKQWFELDDREYQRVKRSRETFMEQCLENYLLSLKACDKFGNDVLRFCALWLDNSNSDIANEAVGNYLSTVPSRKFAPLMNQLSSRLLDVEDSFQLLLFGLVLRICVEHPYHGMYQIFAGSKFKVGNDQMANSRFSAAGKLVEQLKSNRTAGPTWIAIHNTNISYLRFAMEKMDEKLKTGSKVLLRKFTTGQRLEQDVARQKIPPPTMRIELRADCDYSKVPRLTRFLPEFSVASGLSAPKIVTAVASDGLRYKQLFKAGNDDLRQDAIMEQVFEQVSNLLRSHRATQQRNLGIRTYKVLPLTANAGIIEFVQNTLPLHDYLIPAHQKHFPRDMKPNACRKHISDAQAKSLEQRLKVYRQVTDHFHPVMRYFFMERFQNPDDWFHRRLAYTRSMAAISILGHVLGLGDRHGHNILLDEKTGEVVHIDLGVAFEQGRVLPVPEVVPFRLTRDLVDGMGITKTEGVFRRCCEFTLEALRRESYSIMTILDVLRYDPLYSWSLSPLRMKKMQDTQEAAGEAEAAGEGGKGASVNEPSEADRALTVVAKKLSKTLSVAATVNELIQQATDERNLAVLYCGWAAYA